MRRRVQIFGVFVILATVFLLAMPQAGTAAKIELTIAIHTDPGHPMFLVGERVKKDIEQNAKGEIAVRILGLEVGGERDHLEGVSSGEYQIALGGSVPLTLYAPQFAAPDLPFVYPDTASARKIYEGKLGELMNESFIRKGNMRLIGLSPRNPRNLTANKAIKTPSDIQGVKMRVPQIMPWITVWKGVGALPTPIAWPEVYSALQTGVIESQENPVDVLWASRIYEVQKYVMLTQHVYSFFHWLINEPFYQKVSDANRKIILDAVEKETAWGADYVKDGADDLLKKLQEKGMTVVQPDVEAFRKKAVPAIQELVKDYNPEVAKYVLSFITK